jgi:hypothetical protein
MRTPALLFLLVAAPAFAEAPPPAQQRIASPGHFDLAVCFPDVVTPPEKLNADSASALLLSLRADLMECLVPAKNRGAGPETTLSLAVTLAAPAAPAVKIDGPVSETGRACLTEKITARFAKLATPAPVVAEGRVSHVVGVSPGEQAGVSPASDLVASVRVALPTWCDCFAPWKASAPGVLRAEVKVAAGKATEVKLVDTAASAEVGACLDKKLQAHAFPKQKESFSVPVTFALVHSGIEAKLGQPVLQFHQSQSRRAVLFARTQIAASERGLAGDAFNALVKGAKAGKVPAAKLAGACKQVLATGDAWVAALEGLAAEEATLVEATTAARAAEGASWTNAHTAVTRQQAETKDELEAVKASRAADAKACPK